MFEVQKILSISFIQTRFGMELMQKLVCKFLNDESAVLDLSITD